jgi:hypothetical protein
MEWVSRHVDSGGAGGAGKILAASQAKLAKRKLTASRLRSTTTMMTSVCVCYSRLRTAVRNRGCLECEEASVLLASYPKEEAAEAQSLGETASTSM